MCMDVCTCTLVPLSVKPYGVGAAIGPAVQILE